MKRYLTKGEIIQEGDKVWFCVADDGDFYDVNLDRVGECYDGKFLMIREGN